MRTGITKNLGWIVAAALAGVAITVGFAEPTDKYGVADIPSVIERSEFGKANQATFASMKMTRETLLAFIDQNRVMTLDHANRIKELTLKATPTKEESAELDRLKSDAVAATKRMSDLSGKATLTADERAVVADSADQGQKIAQTTQQWFKDFSTEMQDWADKQKQLSLDRARAAVQSVGKAQGFTVVFEAGPAPYGANDISDAALAAMNDKK